MADTHETISDIIAEMRMGNTGPYPFAYLIGRAGGPLGNVIEQVTVKELADRLEAAHQRECDEMLDALVRIGNWCAQDLAENAYVGDSNGNYLKTLNGLCEVCRPFMQKASRLKRYGGVE